MRQRGRDLRISTSSFANWFVRSISSLDRSGENRTLLNNFQHAVDVNATTMNFLVTLQHARDWTKLTSIMMSTSSFFKEQYALQLRSKYFYVLPLLDLIEM